MFHEFLPSGKDIFSTAPVPTPPPHKMDGKVNRNVIMHFLAWMFLPDKQKHSHKVRQWFLSDGTRCNGDGFLSSLLCILKDKREGGIWSCVPVHTYVCIDLYLLSPLGLAFIHCHIPGKLCSPFKLRIIIQQCVDPRLLEVCL